MRKCFLAFVGCIIFAHSANAQFFENNFIYGNVGASIGNYNIGLYGGLNYIRFQKHSFRFNFSYKQTKAKNLHGTYYGGLLGGNAGPPDQYYSYEVMYGRIVSLNPKGTIRLNLQGGAGLRRSQIAINFQNHGGSGFFSFPYTTYDYESKKSLELIVNPRMEFPFARGYGLALSHILIIGRDKTFIGIGLENIFGVVRKKSKPKDSSQKIE